MRNQFHPFQMTTEDKAFLDGELACHQDRKAGMHLRTPPNIFEDRQTESWWLGYMPRSIEWCLPGKYKEEKCAQQDDHHE